MNKRGGFSLIEVLIALIILTIGVVAISRAFSIGLFASTDIENVDLALNIAQANMETIKNQNFSDIDTDAEISGLVSNLGFSNFTVSGDVAEGDNPMQVDVTVAWNVKGGQTSDTNCRIHCCISASLYSQGKKDRKCPKRDRGSIY